MTESNVLRSATEKILNTTLPNEFDFIERVKDVVLTSSEFVPSLKVKIILKRDWVEKNFTKDAMVYVNKDFERDGYCLLSPFTLSVFSDGKIEPEEVENYTQIISSFLGLNTNRMSITTSYIIE